MKGLRVSLVLFMALLLTQVFAQELVAPEDEAPEVVVEERIPATMGFILNAPNLLLDVDAYQGGLGLKFRSPRAGLRLLASLGYESGAGAFETGFGLTYERPFFTGRVTPYWGLAAGLGFESERVEADEDNSTQVQVFSLEAGGVLGAEVLVVDFLSVFAEYQLGFGLASTAIEQRVDGELEEASSRNVFFGAGMGNKGAIGIVVYLRPLGVLGRADAE